MLRLLRRHLTRYQVITAAIDPRRQQAFGEHSHILDALRARDAGAAETRMREHVLAAYRQGSPAAEEFRG